MWQTVNVQRQANLRAAQAAERLRVELAAAEQRLALERAAAEERSARELALTQKLHKAELESQQQVAPRRNGRPPAAGGARAHDTCSISSRSKR